MIIIEKLLMIMLFSLGVLASISDMREGHIYNKMLLVFSACALGLDLIYYGYFARDLILLFLMNFGIVTLISLVLFYTHSFAGGDCKLMLVMALIYPANYYLMYGQVRMTLFFTLCIAIFYGYLYLIGYSIYGLIRRKTKITSKYIKEYLLNFLKSFISASIYISGINLMAVLISLAGINIDIWILRVICMLAAWFVGKNKFLKKWPIVLGVFILDIILGIFLKVIPFSFNPENYILIIILLLCQMTIRTSLYEEILIANLKKGMILSSFSSLLMQNSRVRGLPKVSSEDLKSRLTEEQVESVRRWASGRKIESVTVVKKIPFAIFIFGGFLSYFVLWSVVK